MGAMRTMVVLLVFFGLCLGPAGLAQEPPIWVSTDRLAEHRLSGESVLRAEDRSTPVPWIGVEVTVDESGAVVETRPSLESERSPRDPELSPAAQAAARSWRFRPFERGGRPVRARGVIAFSVLPTERLPTRHIPFPEVRREEVVITLTRTACFGPCPAYRLTIHGDGRVRLQARAGALIEGDHDYRIPVERVDALIARFRAADFWSLEPRYEAPITDQASATLTFAAGANEMTVMDYAGLMVGMPAVVRELQIAADEAADSGRWITGNERTLAALDAVGFDYRGPRAAEMLIEAIGRAPDSLVLALIDRGVPLDAPAPSCAGGCPPGGSLRERALYLALEKGRVAIFDRLDTDSTFAGFSQGERDLMLQRAARTLSPHLVRRMLARGARATARDPRDGTPLMQVLGDSYRLLRAPDADQEAVFRLLLVPELDLEARDGIDFTVLQHAENEDPNFARMLIAAGANVNAHAATSLPILYYTQDEIALIALAAGADRTLRNGDGHSLPEMARRMRWPRVEALLAREGNPPGR